MDYDLIVVKTLERVYKNYYYIIRGKKVLLIDADPQGSLTISLGYEEPDEMEYSLATLMMKN